MSDTKMQVLRCLSEAERPLSTHEVADRIEATESFAEIPSATDERRGELALVDVVAVVGGREHLAFVDHIDADRLQNLGLFPVADAGFSHDRDRDSIDNFANVAGIGHPGDAPALADVCWNGLKRHHRDSPGVFGDPGLLTVDDIHDDAAFLHPCESLFDEISPMAKFLEIGCFGHVWHSHVRVAKTYRWNGKREVNSTQHGMTETNKYDLTLFLRRAMSGVTLEREGIIARYFETEAERVLTFDHAGQTAAVAQNREGYAMVKVRTASDGDELERYYGFDMALDHAAELLEVAPHDLPVPDEATDMGM